METNTKSDPTNPRTWTRSDLRDAREKFNDHVNECEHCTRSIVDGDDDWCDVGDELESREQHINAVLEG